ncbi:hypothetical protein FZO89_09200 [Luteimonas viscosa]|uniref:Uncharacterized protein n=1 Tax=Luteimonas viscosa TaxID=1132694 RepID=A0A5D4XPA8_9GAMM|nr:hypothetical protein [Luteimonas viscosa]TYT26419.1 hypothetical protein FZO89_09200 [Luteimonas viscosa]
MPLPAATRRLLLVAMLAPRGCRRCRTRRCRAQSGLVLVEPIGDKAPGARSVADALSGLAGMQRLDSRLKP